MNKTVYPEIVSNTLTMESENSQNIVEKLCKKQRIWKKTYLLCFFLKMSQNTKINFVLKIPVKTLNSID